MDNEIKEYTTPSGQCRYGFNIYVGKNEATGQTIQIKKQGFKSRDAAEKSYYEYKIKVLNGEYEPLTKRRYTMKDLFKLWSKTYETTVKESTYATALRIFDNHILKDLGNIYIDKLTIFQCQSAVNKWFEVSHKTYKRYIRYASRMLDYAVDLELIDKNPMKKVVRPKYIEQPKEFDNFYSKEELKQFLCCAKKRNFMYYVFFRLLAYSGMRKGEALALKWDRIDFMHSKIKVDKSVSKGINNRLYISTPKTRGSVRTIQMDKQTMGMLKEWRTRQQKEMLKLGYNFISTNNLVFPTWQNKPNQPTQPTQWNNSICEHGHLRHITVHGFRHTHASLLFDSGASMKDVQKRLGHSSMKTTMDIYTHVTKQSEQETVTEFERYMEG